MFPLARANVGSPGHVQNGEQGHKTREGFDIRFYGRLQGQPLSPLGQHRHDKTVGRSRKRPATGRNLPDNVGGNSLPDELQQRRVEENKEVPAHRERSGADSAKYSDGCYCLIVNFLFKFNIPDCPESLHATRSFFRFVNM